MLKQRYHATLAVVWDTEERCRAQRQKHNVYFTHKYIWYGNCQVYFQCQLSTTHWQLGQSNHGDIFTVFTSLLIKRKLRVKRRKRLFLKKLTLKLAFVQPAHRHPLTWSVEAASSLTAAAVATGAGTTAMWVPPPHRLSLRWTAALMKAYTWNWSWGRSLMPRSQRYIQENYSIFSHKSFTAKGLEARGGKFPNKQKKCKTVSLSASVLCICFCLTFSPVLYMWCALSLTELFQRRVQVSVAQLWQGANVVSWNKKTYPCAASGVSWNTFELHEQSVMCS